MIFSRGRRGAESELQPDGRCAYKAIGTLTSYVGALDAAKSAENGSAGFSWINMISRASTARHWANQAYVWCTAAACGIGAGVPALRASPSMAREWEPLAKLTSKRFVLRSSSSPSGEASELLRFFPAPASGSVKEFAGSAELATAGVTAPAPPPLLQRPFTSCRCDRDWA